MEAGHTLAKILISGIFWIQTGIERVWTGWDSKTLNVQALLPIFCPRSYGHMRGRRNT